MLVSTKVVDTSGDRREGLSLLSGPSRLLLSGFDSLDPRVVEVPLVRFSGVGRVLLVGPLGPVGRFCEEMGCIDGCGTEEGDW